jgi:hypothetical protein
MLESHAIGEVTLRSGPASLRRSVEPVPGTLTLTTMRLRFEPSAGLVRGGTLSIPLADVADVELGSSLWVIPNQIVVVRRNGTRHALVVADRDGWAGAVRAATRLATPAG